jgi:hypothetical protein
MHKATRIAILLALPTIVLPGLDASASNVVVVAMDIRVHDATPPQVALVQWAIGRYRNAHLQLPSLDIYLHEDVSGCRGYPGFFAPGRIDLCPGVLLNLIPRDDVLHEMAHAWSLLALTSADREAFMKLRGLTTWNDLNQPWDRRGFEQTAEIIAWGIGDGVLLPLIPDNDEASLVAAYNLLTGSPPPATATSVS